MFCISEDFNPIAKLAVFYPASVELLPSSYFLCFVLYIPEQFLLICAPHTACFVLRCISEVLGVTVF